MFRIMAASAFLALLSLTGCGSSEVEVEARSVEDVLSQYPPEQRERILENMERLERDMPTRALMNQEEPGPEEIQ